MKGTQMPPVHAENHVANSGNTAYGVDVIEWQSKKLQILTFCGDKSCHFAFANKVKWTTLWKKYLLYFVGRWNSNIQVFTGPT